MNLEQLKRHATPTMLVKLAMWNIAQETGDLNHSRRSPFTIPIKKQLGITDEQDWTIVEQRDKIRSICAKFKKSPALIKKTKTLCDVQTRSVKKEMSQVEKVLTPHQIIKLLVLVDNNNSTEMEDDQFQISTAVQVD